jgi:hypothetical protein
MVFVARVRPLVGGQDIPKLEAQPPKGRGGGSKLKAKVTKSSMELGNIGTAGQRQRLLVGIVCLAAASGALVWLEYTSASRWWRLGAFPLIWLGVVGLLQARAKTCVRLAARRICDDDAPGATGGKLTSEAAEILRARGLRILRRATIIAAILTLLAVIPA